MTALLTFIGEAALRGLVVAAAIGAVLALVPRLSATLRLRAWTVVLYAILALPIVGLLAPAWNWPVSPVPVFSSRTTAAPVAGLPTTSAGISDSETAQTATVSVAAIATTIYVAGVSWFVFQAGLGWVFVQRLRRRSRVIDDEDVLDRLADHSRSAGLTSAPILAESRGLFAPITMFVRRPMIVLPDDFRAWPADQMEAVLAHEASHVARRDALTQRLALAYRAIFWFSPLSWWLQRQLGRLAELASDESALASGVEPVTYAGALLACFVRAHERPRPAAWHLAMARRDDRDAARRIERILSWKGGSSMTRTRFVLAGIGVLAAPLTVLAASVRFAPEILPAISAPPAIVVAGPSLPSVPEVAAPVATRTQATTPVPKPTPPSPPAQQTPAPQLPADRQKADEDLEFLKGAYEMNTPELIKPTITKMVYPKYTPDGMRQKLQGTVTVEIIIGPEGTVTKSRIQASLDKIYGLDAAALEAARQCTFTPATLQGQAVAVHTILQMEFRLH